MRKIKRSDPKKKAQIWVETVIYTLIAFVMIGLVLSYAKPKITEMQDKKIIEESMGILEDIDSVILSIKKVVGNKRKVDLEINKGELIVDGISDTIYFQLGSGYEFSELNKPVSYGSITVLTKKVGTGNLITLTSNYSEAYDIKYNNKDEVKTFGRSSNKYVIFMSSKDKINDKTVIDIELS